MNLDMISNFFSKYRRTLLYIGVFVVAIFALGDVAFAAGEQSSSQGDGTSTFFDVLNGGLKIMAAFLGILTAFVSLFLNPEWTSGTVFGLQNHLKEIWILVSNVVYFIFAMILIVIAFMNIIGKSDKWELKQALPRFIIGVLIVPFSWFFVQFVVSVSAILTVGVLTLPYDVFQEADFFTDIESDYEICTYHVLHLGSTEKGGSDKSVDQALECKEGEKKTITDILNSKDEGIKNGIFGIISIYTYGILGVEDKDHLTNIELVRMKDILDLGVKAIFDILFFVVYCILMAALFLALLVRGVWLWMYMMLSPAFGLLYFFEKGSEGVGSEAKFSIKEFVSLALVPVYVSAALSFGLVFLLVASKGISDEITGEDGKQTLEMAGFTLEVTGYQGKTESAFGLKGALSTLIVELFGIVILWIAVMAALKQSETTGKIITPIADFGTSVGKLVASSPMYAPIIPAGPGGQKLSAASLPTISSGLQSAVQTSTTERGQKFLGDNFPSLNNDLQGLRNSIRDTKATFDEHLGKGALTQVSSQLQKYLKEGKNLEILRKSSEFHDVLKRTGEKVGVSLKDKDLSNKDTLRKSIIDVNNALAKKDGGHGILGQGTNDVSSTTAVADIEKMISGNSATGKKAETTVHLKGNKLTLTGKDSGENSRSIDLDIALKDGKLKEGTINNLKLYHDDYGMDSKDIKSVLTNIPEDKKGSIIKQITDTLGIEEKDLTDET